MTVDISILETLAKKQERIGYEKAREQARAICRDRAEADERIAKNLSPYPVTSGNARISAAAHKLDAAAIAAMEPEE